MKLAADRINTTRARVTWALRGLAVLMLVLGAYLCLKRVLFAFAAGIHMAFDAWEGVGESHSFYRGAALVIVGGALAVFARRISRWIIAMPADECPRCGHARSPGGETRCPECGLEQ